MRLDLFLTEKGYSQSRTRAAALIKSGCVSVNGRIANKVSAEVTEDDRIEIVNKEPEADYVSRGRIKLEAAVKRFSVDAEGRVCADIGASTGGFTECLLSHGAVRVYAVDSGHGQLAVSLAKDERVVNLEGVNARYISDKMIPERCSLVVCDVSFISQTLLFDSLTGIITDGGDYIGLIKPQFECGRQALNKKGIVKDPHDHIFAIKKVVDALSVSGFIPRGIMKSPVSGGDGNTEYLVYAGYNKGQNKLKEKTIKEVVLERSC